jgi:hypothetical protein
MLHSALAEPRCESWNEKQTTGGRTDDRSSLTTNHLKTLTTNHFMQAKLLFTLSMRPT